MKSKCATYSRILLGILFAGALASEWCRADEHRNNAIGEPTITVYLSDNLPILKDLPSESVDLIYIDPPFNTGHRQVRRRTKSVNGEKVEVASYGYADKFDDYISFLRPRMQEAYRILRPHGALFFHIDYREVHYCKVMLDEIFGRKCFLNEIVWAYDYGARSRKRWSTKHDDILWYVKDPMQYVFNYEEIDRIPYMAPQLVGLEKASRGKTVTDVWWHTIVSPTGKEKTGYATQKPQGILDRIIKVHSNPGDVVLDFFAGSGTTGASAYALKRNAILIDCSVDAIRVMQERFKLCNVVWHLEDNEKTLTGQNAKRVSDVRLIQENFSDERH